jgi:hypothetical protein
MTKAVKPVLPKATKKKLPEPMKKKTVTKSKTKKLAKPAEPDFIGPLPFTPPEILAPPPIQTDQPKLRSPCAKVALRQNFHRYGSPCKKSAVRELTRLLTRDINQILVMSLGLAATSKRKVLQKHHVLIAHRHYMNRHRFLPSV